ncbi:MAG: hypothetical protein ACRD2E_11540 [Terriglobales bacterium]
MEERQLLDVRLARIEAKVEMIEQTMERRHDTASQIAVQMGEMNATLGSIQSDIRGNAALSRQVWDTHAGLIADTRGELGVVRGWIVALVVATMTALGTIIVHLVWGAK